MADVASAAQLIGRLLVEEAQYLHQVEDKVRDLQTELEWMQCFLRDTDERQYVSSIARKWVGQIREFAYEAEDIVEKFLVKAVPHRTSRADVSSWVRKCCRVMLECKDLRRIGNEIDSLKEKISALTSRLQLYGIELNREDIASSLLSELRRRESFYFRDHKKEENIIGQKHNEVYNLTIRELGTDQMTRVFAICGVSGVGKSFVARKIFHSKEIRECFDAFAFAYVSEPCQISSLQQEILSSLTSKSSERIAQMTDPELKDELRKFLTKHKSLVVLDGLYSEQVWDGLQDSFAIKGQGFKSKLLLTTQSVEVAKYVDSKAKIHELHCFDIGGPDSWSLLKEKVRSLADTSKEKVAKHVDQNLKICEIESLNEGGSELLDEDKVGLGLTSAYRGKATSADVAKRNEPESKLQLVEVVGHDLDDTDKVKVSLAKEMLVYCDGLPLAIVLLGGVLATKNTKKEWRTVRERIASHLLDQDDDALAKQPGRRILELSYYELPYQLKPCFQYLGSFPTNLEIHTRKITLLWEAEGLVLSEDETSEETLQVIAENWLAELVERSLVQVGSRTLTGNAKTCRLHDLMRKLCVYKSSKGNWLTIVPTENNPSDITSFSSSSKTASQAPKSSRFVKRRFRRLAIYCSETLDKLPSQYRHAQFVKSLLFFNTSRRDDVLMPLQRSALKKSFSDFKLLRVLDIEHIEVQRLPHEVGFLIHLRYLSIRGSWICELPSTIRYLKCLEALDLRVMSFVHLRIPNVLVRMKRLVHLYLPQSFVLRHKAQKLHLNGLVKLETLENYGNLCRATDVMELRNLRKFSSSNFLTEKKIIEFLVCSCSQTFSHIENIHLKLDGKILKNNPQILERCIHLRQLWVKGEITQSQQRQQQHSLNRNPIMQSLSFPKLPESIVQLSFWHSKFMDDPMPVLKDMPLLRRLALEEGSYEGKMMTCHGNGFQELTHLTLSGLASLEDWQVEPGAMSKLVHLKISKCQKLRTIPEGLKHIKSLQELTLSYMPLSFYQNWTPARNKQDWPDYYKVQHVPHIKHPHIMDLS